MAKLNIKPLADRVIIEPSAAEEKTSGGIIIPDTAKEKPQEGKVVSVGLGKRGDDGKRIPPEVKKGDRVLFSKYAGTEIKLEDIEHLMINESEIMAVLE